MAGKQIRMFLVDGTVGGLVTAEIHNWTGHLLKGKRERLNEIQGRPEAGRTGVYILFGDDAATSGKRSAYIGQSDNVGLRLKNHDSKKEFWDEVVIITSKDMNLTSAHVRYLESALINLAKKVGRVSLENVASPTGGAPLPEADASDMEYFLSQLKIVLPVLGYDLLRGRAAALPPSEVVTDTTDKTTSPTFHLRGSKKHVDATAQLVDGEFTLLEGSRIALNMDAAVNTWAETTKVQHATRQELRSKLFADGALRSEGAVAVATRDIVFSSPSAASATALGKASSNGRIEWKTQDGQTFSAWEQSVG